MPRKAASKAEVSAPMPRTARIKKLASKVLKKPSFKRSKLHPALSQRHKMPSAYRLYIQACKVPLRHWEVFGGLLLLYGLINVFLIGSLTSTLDLEALKAGLANAFTGQFGQITTGLALFGFLITQGPGTAATGVASAYQNMLLVVLSLAIIWALRQVYAGHKIRIRDPLYHGVAPLIQSILVLLYVGLQLLPAVIGGIAFTALVGTGILQQWYEIAVVGVFLFAGLVASVYMITASVFALYIVTLPEVTPWQAIKSAKDIVRGRRAKVFLKLLFLPLALVVCAAVVMVPIALLLTPAAPYVFFVLTIVAILLVHSYVYAVYRELIA